MIEIRIRIKQTETGTAVDWEVPTKTATPTELKLAEFLQGVVAQSLKMAWEMAGDGTLADYRGESAANAARKVFGEEKP